MRRHVQCPRFGATGDGKTFDTAAIQKALDACKEAGGMVEFPAGTYLSQPLTWHTTTHDPTGCGGDVAGEHEPDGFHEDAPVTG